MTGIRLGGEYQHGNISHVLLTATTLTGEVEFCSSCAQKNGLNLNATSTKAPRESHAGCLNFCPNRDSAQEWTLLDDV